jgi:rhomboid protease GluP
MVSGVMEHAPRNSILCPNCRRLISRDEPRCPYCGTPRPGMALKHFAVFQIFRSPRLFAKTVIAVNIGMYAISLLLNVKRPGLTVNPFTLFAPESASLMILGATGEIPIGHYHRWWTLISANFLHGSLLHLLFNMMAFWQLCPLVIREYGIYRTIILYTASGVAGFWVSSMAGVDFTIGASAAVLGLMGASIYYGKSRGGLYGQAIYKQVGGWVLGLFAMGFLIPVINNWAHGGGLLCGIVLGFFLGYEEKSAENRFHRVIGSLCVVVIALTLIWAITTGVYLRLNIGMFP